VVLDTPRRLRREVQYLRNQNSELREGAVASQRLASLLEFKERASVDSIAAQVIARDPSNWYRGVVLDKGERDGIRSDQLGALPHLCPRLRRPRLVLNLVNEAVLRHDDEQFCTVAYVRLRPEGDGARLTISCAGHPLPLLLRGDGNVEKVAAPGRVLGPFSDLASVDRVVRLDPGDALLLYTDGVTDARGPEGFFGDERLRTALAACAGSSADDTVKAIERSLRDFHGGRPRDDIAFVVVRVPA
jgi:hypothetical protein